MIVSLLAKSRRSVSRLAFDVKAIRSGAGFQGGIQLAEVWLGQAAVAFEDLPLGAADRPGGDGGQFDLAIRLVKIAKGHLQPAQAIQTDEQPTLIGNADDDEMRME
jgi:hypothetical protein